MATKKKRNKKYRGAEASSNPQTIRITAKERSTTAQWLYENKTTIVIRTIQILAILIVLLLILWIF